MTSANPKNRYDKGDGTIVTRQRMYQLRNKEKEAERRRKYYAENKEMVNAKLKKWLADFKEEHGISYHAYRKKAKKAE